MKYILVTGGVISGVGKGVIASSFGTILKTLGIHVTSIKIDPYINIDAGTFSPYEHGETFVLDDGGEVDLDLGNYERFLDVTLHKDNNITTGKIYQHVIQQERLGNYLGRTVQVVPHITDAIQEWVERVAERPVDEFGHVPEVCIIEVGGTIGDIEGMPFVEAFRQFQFKAKKENFCCAHVSLVPQPKATGEPKTKPTQASVRELRGLGLSPDLIVCRSENPLTEAIKSKISMFCHVPPEQVLSIHDVSSIYRVPLLMDKQGVAAFFRKRLDLRVPSVSKGYLRKWKTLAERVHTLRKELTIALVGKYTTLEDSYTSVAKALQHAAIDAGYKVNVTYIESANLEPSMQNSDPVLFHEAWQSLCKSDGVVVPGGFGTRGVEGKILASKWCRETNKPFLGICLGLQAAVIDVARHVANLKDATSTEIDAKCSTPVVIEMPEHNTGEMGGTMRLGRRTTKFRKLDCILRKLYRKDEVEERHRHRYEVNPKYIDELERAGLQFVGTCTEGKRMEMVELKDHQYFVAVQFHPEYLSRPLKPSPPFMGLILAAGSRLQLYLSRGCQLSPDNETSDCDDDGSTSSVDDLIHSTSNLDTCDREGRSLVVKEVGIETVVKVNGPGDCEMK